MKKIFLLLALCATVFVACSDDDEKDNENKDEEIETTPWEIKMTVNIERNETEFKFEIEGIESTDWGDASSTSTNKSSHYYNTGSYTIIVKGKSKENQEVKFKCDGNTNKYRLTSLDVTKCTALTTLECNNNALNSLDVTKCINLTELYCGENNLTSLDVTKCINLFLLRCDNNKLTTLDITKCIKLGGLNCDNNQLSLLDISKCVDLVEIAYENNNFNEDAMNTIYNGLPDRGSKEAGIIFTSDMNNIKGNTSIARNKNWKFEVLNN